MARRRAFLTISLSILMGIAAAWMAGNWVRRAGQAKEVPIATVVAADIAIPFGTTVDKRHLKMLKMPAQYAPPGSFSSIDDVVGRVTLQPIVAGEILMRERFAEHNDGSTLAAMVDKKMRAVTVRVDDVIGVAGFLLPGNRVDVLASRTKENRRATAETVLRDIKVLAVDQTAATDESKPVVVRAVTLEVTPGQAEALVKAKAEGSIQLTLRNPLDDDVVVESEPEAPKAAPRPVSVRPPGTSSVTVIRGTDVSTTKAKS